MKLIDLGFQFSFWILYRLACVWFWIFRSHLNGVFVVIWHDGRFLSVRTSYKTEWSVPGGMLSKGEEWIDAAVREVMEEVGIELTTDDLVYCCDVQGGMGRNDHAKIFECVLAEAPVVTIDNREIVEARFCSPSDARAMRMNPHILDYLKTHSARTSA